MEIALDGADDENAPLPAAVFHVQGFEHIDPPLNGHGGDEHLRNEDLPLLKALAHITQRPDHLIQHRIRGHPLIQRLLYGFLNGLQVTGFHQLCQICLGHPVTFSLS